MFGKLKDEEIEDLIRSQLIGRIGCHADGVTYVVPISYVYDGDYIYAHTFEGMKVNMMRKNPEVCFQVDDTKDMANWQSAIVWGVFEELPKGSGREAAAKKLEERVLPIIHSETMHITPEWPFPSSDPSSVQGIMFRIKVSEKTGRFEKSKEGYFFAT